ncbi:VWA domain-containing protein [Isoptericola jiangsuensis]|uniref:VWA domain-containing protein n=1 Tax=Isoptericola jiangsuensis TaxID=548579 RepID=UPI001146022C|nr:VWA domain-containing protein [Isoptericola jiangsuensis]
MSRTRRAGVVVTAVLLALAAVPVGTLPAGAATLSDAGADAFAELSACVAGTDRLVASIVVDESASLKSTDPADERVGAVEVAVDTLAALEASGADVDVELAVFGEQHTRLVGWGSPSGEHGQRVRQAIRDELPSRKEAQHTDYREALHETQASIAARQAQVDGDSCSAVLWFTDGKLDVGADGADPADEDARKELCRPGGIVDGIRSSGTTVIALALFAQGDDTVTPRNRHQLRAVAEGEGKGVTCGTLPVPDGAVGGAYLRADQPSALRRLFSGAGALMEGFTPSDGGALACPLDCPVVVHADAAVGSFRIVHEVEAGGAPMRLTAPDGSTHELTRGSGGTSGSSISTTENDGLFVTDVTPGPAGAGDWLLDGDSGTVVDLYHRWGASVEVVSIEDADGLVIGEENTLALTVHSLDGTVAPPSLFADPVGLTVTVDGETVPATPQDDGTYTVPVIVPADSVPAEVEVAVTAVAVSAPHRVPLGPVVAVVGVPTVLPATYPTITPTRLDLPRMPADEPTTAAFDLSGPADGETSACFGSAAIDGPVQAGRIDLGVDDGAAPGGCVVIPAGATVSVPVTVTAESVADGSLSGTLPVTVTGANGGEEITLEVPVSGSMFRPVDEGKRWLILIALLVGAVGLAWATAETGRRLADRYRLGDDLRYARVQVRIDAGGVRRRDGDLLITPDDFRRAGVPAVTSRFEVAGLVFDRTAPIVPLLPMQGRVRAHGQLVLTGVGTPSHVLDEKGSAAPVRFPGTGHLYLLLQPPAERTPETSDGLDADLVLLVPARHGSVGGPIARWTADLTSYTQWPEIVEAARAAFAARERGSAPAGRSPRPGRLRRADRRPSSASEAPATTATTDPAVPDLVTGARPADTGPPSFGDGPPSFGDGSPSSPSRRGRTRPTSWDDPPSRDRRDPPPASQPSTPTSSDDGPPPAFG